MKALFKHSNKISDKSSNKSSNKDPMDTLIKVGEIKENPTCSDAPIAKGEACYAARFDGGYGPPRRLGYGGGASTRWVTLHELEPLEPVLCARVEHEFVAGQALVVAAEHQCVDQCLGHTISIMY